jgi:hypothetical protein
MRSGSVVGVCLIAVIASACGGASGAEPTAAADATTGGSGAAASDAGGGDAGGSNTPNPDAGAPDSGAPDAGPPDSGPSGPTLSYAPTGAKGCDAFTPHLSVAPTVAPADAVASCGAPFDADIHGRAVFVCPGDASGWSLRLVDATGAVVRSFDSGDAGPQDAWASAAQDGIVGIVDPPDGGDGQLWFADGKKGLLWSSSQGSPLGAAYDFEGAFLIVQRGTQNTWQRYDDLGNPVTQERSLPGVLVAASFWASIDVRGNVLAAWQPQAGAATQAQWFGQDLAPIGTPFSLGTTSWPEVLSMAGGGLAVSASADDPDHWTGVLKPGDSAIDPVPSLRLDRGSRAYWTVFSGESYAFADAACPNASWPCPTASAEIVTPEGIACGVLTLHNADGSARPFVVTRAGTILDAQPSGARAWRWWPAVLR